MVTIFRVDLFTLNRKIMMLINDWLSPVKFVIRIETFVTCVQNLYRFFPRALKMYELSISVCFQFRESIRHTATVWKVYSKQR